MTDSSDHLLFYGDSITDCSRDRADASSLGYGYVRLIADRLSSNGATDALRFSNTGISGNRIYDLEERLEQDVIALRPTLVSILVGINDTWHSFNHGKSSPISEFTAAYDRILTRLQAEPNLRVVILEPFLLPIPDDRREWRSDLDERIAVIRTLAWKYKIPYLALDGLFATASVGTGHAHWLPDGVHPSAAGHQLIADNWLKAFNRGDTSDHANENSR